MEGTNSSFVFGIVTREKIEKIVTKTNIRKTFQPADIPTKLVQQFGYSFSKYIATNINRCVAEGILRWLINGGGGSWNFKKFVNMLVRTGYQRSIKHINKLSKSK